MGVGHGDSSSSSVLSLFLTCDLLMAENLLEEGSAVTSELSQVLAALKADSDRDVRYFMERATSSSLTSDSDC